MLGCSNASNAAGMANCVDPDQTAPSEQSDLGLHCLLKHICPNIEILKIRSQPLPPPTQTPKISLLLRFKMSKSRLKGIEITA